MRQLLLFIVFAAAIASVGYVAVNPIGAPGLAAHAGAAERMERELAAASQQALEASELTWAMVEMDGQIAVLRGEAPREEERAAAIAAVRRAMGPGGWAQGAVIAVRDLTTIAPPISPYEWRAVRSGERVTLAGATPTRAARAELSAYASDLFAGGVADQMIIARGAPDEGAWLTVARIAIAQLATLEDGAVVLRDARLTIDGRAADGGTRDRVTAAMRQLPAPFLAVARVEAPDGAVPAIAVPVDGGEDISQITDFTVCREVFASLVQDETVAFAEGEPAIAKESYPLLDRLAIAAIRCRGVKITIEGGGDAAGDASAYAALGLRRAQAVADYFILKGISEDRLESVALPPDTGARTTEEEPPILEISISP